MINKNRFCAKVTQEQVIKFELVLIESYKKLYILTKKERR